MAFPKIFDELRAANYKFLDYSVCRDCGDEIEWWETPSGKKIPLNHKQRGTDPVEVHFDYCSGR